MAEGLMPALPVVVIGGYLGAGKTTLVNHLLRQAQGRRIAVLVNDFGDIEIDADLIQQAAAGTPTEVLSLAGGCLCCSFGNDLVGTLRSVQQRQPAVDLVLIELSGVALPAAVHGTLRLLPGVSCLGTLVLADAGALRRQAADRYVGETVLQQLQQADWVLLNKPDRIATADVPELLTWLAGVAPQARLMHVAVAELPAELVLDWQSSLDAEPEVLAPDLLTPRPWSPLLPHANRVFASRTAVLRDGQLTEELARELAAADGGVLRAKALARDAQGQGWLLQLAGGHWALSPAAVQGPGRLVLIGLQGVVDAPDFHVPGCELNPPAGLTRQPVAR